MNVTRRMHTIRQKKSTRYAKAVATAPTTSIGLAAVGGGFGVTAAAAAAAAAPVPKQKLFIFLHEILLFTAVLLSVLCSLPLSRWVCVCVYSHFARNYRDVAVKGVLLLAGQQSDRTNHTNTRVYYTLLTCVLRIFVLRLARERVKIELFVRKYCAFRSTFASTVAHIYIFAPMSVLNNSIRIIIDPSKFVWNAEWPTCRRNRYIFFFFCKYFIISVVSGATRSRNLLFCLSFFIHGVFVSHCRCALAIY